MAASPYRSSPEATDKMPKGMAYILSNEAAERFSFYGMSSILMVFMTKYLMGSDGILKVMSNEEAKTWFHVFTAAVYCTPLIGAFISDIWLGKFRTIIIFSILYCVGFGVLAWDDTRSGLTCGLVLIALGSGIVKPCVSANVGDQFSQSNKHLLQKMFSWFYFSINLGACISMLACPWLLDRFGTRWGFGVPAVLMVLATVAFWMGRKKYVHIPPAGKSVLQDILNPEILALMGRLSIIYLFASVFFALYYQSQSAWVLQAENMELRWLWINWLPAQVQFVNSLYILIMIPLFSYVIYPLIDKVFPLTDLRKVGLGMLMTAGCFLVPIWIEHQIAQGSPPSIGWQFFAYIFLTGGEIMVSVTVLEFAYTQAPKKMKSFIMCFYLLAIALGNVFAAGVNHFIRNADGSSKLSGADYYWFFLISMLVTAILFIPVARWYPVKEYIQKVD